MLNYGKILASRVDCFCLRQDSCLKRFASTCLNVLALAWNSAAAESLWQCVAIFWKWPVHARGGEGPVGLPRARIRACPFSIPATSILRGGFLEPEPRQCDFAWMAGLFFPRSYKSKVGRVRLFRMASRFHLAVFGSTRGPSGHLSLLLPGFTHSQHGAVAFFSCMTDAC